MKLFRFIPFVFVVLTLTSCAFKAEPAPATQFLAGPEKLEQHRERYPFHEIWVSDEYKENKSQYTKFMIRDVDLDHLMTTGDWKHINVYSEDEMKVKAKELAEYMKESFPEAFSDDYNTMMEYVEKPDENTLVLDVAIVELVPTDVVRNAAGNVVGFFVPGGGLVSAGAGGSIATEGKMYDGETGELLAKFKDRESAKIRPVDLEGLSPFAFAREAIDDWADQTMRLLNTPMEEKVSDVSAVSLAPW